MTIRQTGRKKVKTVRVITDADPRRVSLVEHGANQTPWREVKMAAGTKAAKAIKKKENGMPKTKSNKSGAELVRITFAQSTFKDEASVKSWLTEKGYEQTDVLLEGDNFVVSSPLFSEAKSEDIRIVEAESGVSYSIVKVDTLTDDGSDVSVKSDTNDNADDAGADEVDDEPVEDADIQSDDEGDVSDEVNTKSDDTRKELTEKVNMMRVYYSEKTKMKDVLKDANDGMPLGVSDIYSLFTKSLQNAAEAGDTDAIKSISSEFGDMFTQMMDVTNKFIAGATSDEDVSKQVSAATEKAAKAVATAEAGKALALDEVNSLKEQVAKAVSTTQETSTATEALVKSVNELTDTIKSLMERVSELESVEQSRKGADEDASTNSTTKTQKTLSRLEKNLWGI